ncbi:MAG TPA: hypothetical protein VH062_36765 [Polyangiaceae bacterium]|jgi:hypothetical protein|nr:hypothetical protein [Polyangiaceae bacterium]
MSRFRYPQPPNEDAFEEFCLALGKEAWSKPLLERYGHRGERQHGIDLLDMSGDTPLFAVQCKHHAPNRTLPPPVLETAVLASQPNRILWSDDGVYALIARERLGVRRIWTQAALAWLVDEGRIGGEVHTAASARLIGWGYSFTRSNPAIMREAGRLAEWNRERWPLNEAVKYLGLQEVRPGDAIFLGVSLVKDGYREGAIQEQRRGLLLDVLAALRQRLDMSESLLDDFDRFLPKLFGLDALGADDARKTFRAWRAGGRKVVLRS